MWPLLDRVRGLTSQWLHRTLGLRGSAHGNDNVADAMHTKHQYGGLGVPDVVNIYVECMTPTWLAGAHSHAPAVRAAYMSRIYTQANAAIAVSLASSISEQRSSSMNRLSSRCSAWAFAFTKGTLLWDFGVARAPRDPTRILLRSHAKTGRIQMPSGWNRCLVTLSGPPGTIRIPPQHFGAI